MGASHADIADIVVPGQAAAGDSVPLGSLSAQLPNRDASSIEGTNNVPHLALFLLSALLSVPVVIGGTESTVARLDGVVATLAVAGHSIEVAIGRAGRQRIVDFFA